MIVILVRADFIEACKNALLVDRRAWNVSSREYMKRILVTIMFLPVLMLSGCMSNEWHLKKADKAAIEIISEYQQEALGRTEPFTIEEPSNSLRRRLMISQELPGHVSGVTSEELFKSDKPLKITLLDAMQFAARNTRDCAGHPAASNGYQCLFVFRC